MQKNTIYNKRKYSSAVKVRNSSQIIMLISQVSSIFRSTNTTPSGEIHTRSGLSPSSQRRRIPFVPFVLHNQTGCTLWFLTVTTNPSGYV